jgi:hypothetical protein
MFGIGDLFGLHFSINFWNMLLVFVAFALPVFFALCCEAVAKRKNRNQWGWASAGFVFGVFALILVALKEPLIDASVEFEQSQLKGESYG